MWIRNAWYVAAWADEVTADALLNRIYLGTPVILYRTADGGLVAMEDRCCHRHAPLSKGRLEGDDIRCMYHGLKFAPSGKCTEIPGEEKVPPQMKVATFPVAERDSLVWIWLGDPALANEGDIVHCPRLTEPGWRHQQGYLRYDTDYRLIVDNLLDLTHLAYVHAGTIGQGVAGRVRPDVAAADHGLHIRHVWENDDPSPHHVRAGGFSGKIDRWNSYDWHLRGNLMVMDTGVAAAGTGGPDGDRDGAMLIQHLSALTPETEHTTHYHFTSAYDFALDDDEIAAGFAASVVAAFHEDKDIIEAQQKVIDLEPSRPMMVAPFDGALTQIRRRIAEIVEQEAASGRLAAE